ncbi:MULTISPECIES: transglycosylase SLT domain-containing protein [Thioalkalivibrio]|uniref:transglycosylase SLT domain-containing protein n=1 Tax=Thioalkalivibrio TaxID=106633 RepID=UPI00037240C1|nr:MULTISPECIES: transglycosylase SLT domain-containing protein [Thioalkalivibrio]OOC50331.1 lytic murein transglycosylase [Thioalkalivibrio versutus]
MLQSRNVIAGLAGLLLVLAAALPAAAGEEDLYVFERSLYLLAERALNRGDMTAYRAARSTLTGYPLTPYLDYRDLARNLNRADPDAVRRFVREHDDTPLAARLHGSYLTHLAREEQWGAYLEFLDSDRSLSVEQDCNRRQALLETGERDAALEDVESIWLHGQSRPSACDPALKAWRDAGGLTGELAWDRFVLAVEAGQTGLARYLRRYLDRDDRPWAERWLDLASQPARVVEADFDAGAHRSAEALMERAFTRWIRQDLDAALEGWEKDGRDLGLSSESAGRVQHALALRLALRYRPEALDFMAALEPEVFDTQLRQWQVRAALYERDWEVVMDAIRAMDRDVRDEAAWQYWYARALEQIESLEAARGFYERAARERNFYGFLAADRLGQPYRIGHQPLVLEDGQRAAMRTHAGMQRMRELVRLDRNAEARREWTHAVADMDTAELEAAARTFADWGWHDRAIFTAARARNWDDIELRFPLAFDDLIVAGAREQGIDPAWAMAIARQESAFLYDVRSGAGALGIMQVMPATGRSIASAAGVRVNSDWDILDPATNARLGTYYLRRNLDRFGGHSMLSSAAYNAGAHRVSSWLPEDRAMDPDIWAELIPFSETRDYIRRVFAYRILYAVRLGQEPPSLATLLYPVTPQDGLAASRERHLATLPGEAGITLSRAFCDAPGYTDNAC